MNCFTSTTIDKNSFIFVPSYSNEESDNILQQNIKKITWKGVEILIDGIKYVLNKKNNQIYDYDSYLRGQAIQTGYLEMNEQKYQYIRI